METIITLHNFWMPLIHLLIHSNLNLKSIALISKEVPIIVIRLCPNKDLMFGIGKKKRKSS